MQACEQDDVEGASTLNFGFCNVAVLSLTLGCVVIYQWPLTLQNPRRLPISGFGPLLPMRFQAGKHNLDANLVQWLAANRCGILIQGHPPLGRVLRVPPPGFHADDELVSQFSKRWQMAADRSYADSLSANLIARRWLSVLSKAVHSPPSARSCG